MGANDFRRGGFIRKLILSFTGLTEIHVLAYRYTFDKRYCFIPLQQKITFVFVVFKAEFKLI